MNSQPDMDAFGGDGKDFEDHTVREFLKHGFFTAARWKAMPYAPNNPKFQLGMTPPKGYLKLLILK